MKIKIYNSTIEQPGDRCILLRDILEEAGEIHQRHRGKNKGGIHTEKSPTLTANKWEYNNKLCLGGAIDGKSPTLQTTSGGNREPKVEVRVKPRGNNRGSIRKREKCPSITTSSFEHNVHIRDKSYCIDANYGNGVLAWRKLTPIECERLQTLPDGYTELGNYNGVVKKVADSNRYRALGNGWTVEVIKHIL